MIGEVNCKFYCLPLSTFHNVIVYMNATENSYSKALGNNWNSAPLI